MAHPSSYLLSLPDNNIVMSPELTDVWVNVIGPSLEAIDIVSLSMVCKWGHVTAHAIQKHDGYAWLVLKKVSLIDLEITRLIERVWPNLKLGLSLEDWLDPSEAAAFSTSFSSSTPRKFLASTFISSPRKSDTPRASSPTSSTTATTFTSWGSVTCRPSALVLHRCHPTNFEFIDSLRLEKLSLIATRLGGSARVSLFQCLKSARNSLTSLDITGGWLGADGIRELGTVISNMPRLEHMNLAYHDLGPGELQLIVPALQTMSHITSLSIFGNQLGSSGAQHLAPALATMTRMKTLDLRQNGFGSEGARIIAPALTHMPHITSLNLCSNELGSAGAMYLVPALTHMKHMAQLNLAFNEIDAVTKEMICKSLDQLPRSI
eukprot:c7193_g1_i1.p1 GENE.c7193_g1_i1~~c7193_g1_i1.p1  ORF type:complete len:377 (+),score=76.84 c7193_g1_i1:227-1357(+)